MLAAEMFRPRHEAGAKVPFTVAFSHRGLSLPPTREVFRKGSERMKAAH